MPPLRGWGKSPICCSKIDNAMHGRETAVTICRTWAVEYQPGMIAQAFMKPRISRVVWTDWPALFSAVAIPIIWLICILFPFMRRGVQPLAPHLLILATSISILAALALGWRIVRIQRLFRHGHSTTGRITRIQTAKDRGRVEFSFELSGRSFDSWTPVHKNRQVLALRENQEVEILVDPTQPKNAIIRHLYT